MRKAKRNEEKKRITYDILVDVENLEAGKTVVLLDHLRADVHGFVVGVADACSYVLQIQGFLPFLEPFVLGVPQVRRLLLGRWLDL